MLGTDALPFVSRAHAMIDALLWIEAHPGLAGYIQAIGSVAAVVIAIWLSSWRRRALERATALEVRGMLVEASWSLYRAQFAFPEEQRRSNRAPPDDDYPMDSDDSGPPYVIKPAVAAADVARACKVLQRVQLFNLSPRCAPLISALQEALSHAAKHLSAYAEGDGPDWLIEEEEFERYEEQAYNLILAIYQAEPTTRDGDVAQLLSGEVALAEAIRSALLSRIGRANVRSWSVAAMWRSLGRHLRIRTTRRAQV